MSGSMEPLVTPRALDSTFAWRDGEPVSLGLYLAHVAATAERLPAREFAVNLCEDRYAFLVSFAAAMLAGQTTLLPPSRAAQVIEEIVAEHDAAYCLVDQPRPDLGATQHTVALEGSVDAAAETAIHQVPADQLAAIVFTSGSTGRARPNPKRWGGLVKGAVLTARRLGLDRLTGATIVSTVPPQHMYGLETSVILPLTSGVAVHAGQPFFPADVRAALGEVSAPRILVSTPVHLEACMQAELAWPGVEMVISATAPLPQSLAVALENAMGAKVIEIYGCTEAGAIATRETARGPVWHLIDGLTLIPGTDQRVSLSGPPLADDVILDDRLKLHDAHRFELLGRHADLIKIAGKRMSLGDLNHKLNEIAGVEDGLFLLPDPGEGSGVTRLAAFVVAPELSDQDILEQLAKGIDPVFMPRPLIKLAELPRGATGKVPREALMSLLAQRRGPT